MARKFEIGDIVYESYSPVKCGVIEDVLWPPKQPVKCHRRPPLNPGQGIGAVLGQPVCILLKGHDGDHVVSRTLRWPNVERDDPAEYQPPPTYVVRKLNGNRFQSKSVKRYQSLIDEHQKKLDTHRNQMEKLAELRTQVFGTWMTKP